ncbi:hypothetical protein [Gracilibacillus xinjiangensis]|uniref:Uncharacterized protein n=1 Tax=Gracilibacillus xinjiangensis TaxID=1193282 RepID=A0ABV8WTP3_9BACI
MDEMQRKTGDSPMMDSELKEYIQQELEKLDTQQQEEREEDSQNASTDKMTRTLSSVLEQLPLEELMESAISTINKTQPENTSRPKRRLKPKRRVKKMNR